LIPGEAIEFQRFLDIAPSRLSASSLCFPNLLPEHGVVAGGAHEEQHHYR
jgi:hypothetical protein